MPLKQFAGVEREIAKAFKERDPSDRYALCKDCVSDDNEDDRDAYKEYVVLNWKRSRERRLKANASQTNGAQHSTPSLSSRTAPVMVLWARNQAPDWSTARWVHNLRRRHMNLNLQIHADTASVLSTLKFLPDREQVQLITAKDADGAEGGVKLIAEARKLGVKRKAIIFPQADELRATETQFKEMGEYECVAEPPQLCTKIAKLCE